MKDFFNELVLTRQSCRDFNDKPLSLELVLKIAEQARFAPSACNSQPWKMYVVADSERLNGVFEALNERGHNNFLSKAKAFIVITEKDAILKETVGSKFDRNHFVKYDIGQLTAYITLVAESLGVSSCIIGWINQDKLRQTVGYTDSEQSNIVVALGYSNIPVREKKRKDVLEVVTRV